LIDFSLKVKFERTPPSETTDDANQDTLIRHLQSRISDLRDDNMRLRDNHQSKSSVSSFNEVTNYLEKSKFLLFKIFI
jgi:hypothetical protein